MTADDSSINGMAALERSWDVRFMVVTRTLANMNIDNTKLLVWFRCERYREARTSGKTARCPWNTWKNNASMLTSDSVS